MASDAERKRVDAYLDTIGRLEPDIAMIDTGAALASIAISLKRIADAQVRLADAADRNWKPKKRFGAAGLPKPAAPPPSDGAK